MNEVHLLYAALAAFYFWECACWIRRGGVAFRSCFGLRWSAVHPGGLLGNQSGAFVFAPPLPPLGTIHAAYQFPVSVSEDALLSYVSTSVNPGWRPPQVARRWLWDDIRQIETRQKAVCIDGQVAFHAPSLTLAGDHAEALELLRKTSKPRRATAIHDQYLGQFDLTAIRARLDGHRQAVKPVAWASNALFLWLFALAPLLIQLVGLRRCWLPLAIGALSWTWLTAFFFHRVHRRLYPEAADDRFTHTLSMILFPPAAVRALDPLSRPLLERFHPLAVAVALLGTEGARGFARHVLKELRYPAHPVCPGDDPAAIGTEAWSRRELVGLVEGFLQQQGLDPASLLRPPAPEDPACQRYCPRCGEQYRESVNTCADCGGLPLEPLEPRSGNRPPDKP